MAVRLRILEDGTVGAAEVLDSSGYPRLDQAALAYARRNTYEPGTVDGKPAVMGYDTLIFFQLTDGPRPGLPPPFCHSRPILGASLRIAKEGESKGLRVAQWIHAESGTIDDVLLWTSSGWMHVSAPILELYRRNVTVRRVRPSCWYKGDVTVPVN